MRWKHLDLFKIWRRWFAWRPVLVGDEYVWGEYVERRLTMYGHDTVWEYRNCE